jgi:hypothetical protein
MELMIQKYSIFLFLACLALPGAARLARGGQAYVAQETSEMPLSQQQVQEVQQALQNQGYYDGAIDGVMGLKTSEAVQRFQSAQHLPMTGQMDAATLTQLGVTWQHEHRLEGSQGGGGLMRSNGKKASKGSFIADQGTTKGGKKMSKGASITASKGSDKGMKSKKSAGAPQEASLSKQSFGK